MTREHGNPLPLLEHLVRCLLKALAITDHEGEVKGLVHHVHSKLPELCAQGDAFRGVVPEEVGGHHTAAELVEEHYLVEERLASEGVMLVTEERALNLPTPLGRHGTHGSLHLLVKRNAGKLLLATRGAVQRGLRKGLLPLFGILHMLKVGAHNVLDRPDILQGLPELLIQANRAVHPKGAVSQPDYCAAPSYVDAIPHE
eukprot:CAMPEP_0117657154 /NCGR_PEP_ID=MMETSP0804-20121206/5182_1 /TAXON_ID=1074897 /ORGANISM="Tetraselmis astigmatica, Strain CCMP880" /LENGTH=199 /DNA_ID=CAMNT_0005463595 /DNA_START=619 /DNA_END=1218 /DNA_ORIENTATION=+